MADIIVLGAGMVGISTALAFQKRGHSVIVVDRKQPGRETSFGNAGIIQSEAAEPYALPLDISTLFKMAAGISNDVVWSVSGLMRMTPALLSYFRNSLPGRHRRISQIYAGLTCRATQDHAPLIEAANAQNMISKEGLCVLYRDPRAFEEAAAAAERIRSTYGVPYRALAGVDYAAEEPALKVTPAGGIHWEPSWSCANPGALVEAYADLFRARGGEVLEGDAATLKQAGGSWSVSTAGGTQQASTVVVALGPWSPQLLRSFGYRIPMVYKRGYHGHYESRTPLRRPFMDAANGVVAASMQTGLRISTGAALVPLDAPAEPKQLVRGRQALGELIDLGRQIEEPQWFGTRPCLPDMLPLVGPSPRHKGLLFNFGHGHQGFTLGPTTGDLLAEAFDTPGSGVLTGLDPTGRIAV
ncbi:NAD(P)/FAD-dependent oxidoreductase [Roseibium litorale]|uniref:FAD-binding oxidoreductase n=1 Tax=Roseibium litorale TaxID=2803841 RepID=A0ABR9CSE6_9HYPH|nr:FAD-binding oxidoreductase [Roseibium litorale]MBD8893623.1 FAD-binding oxidoreductase [Roseibium litorale]